MGAVLAAGENDGRALDAGVVIVGKLAPPTPVK